MSQVTIDVLSIIYRSLIGVGALASVWFFFDYIRTADTNSPFARMLLALNGAIGLILTISLIRFFVNLNIWVNLLTLVGFIVVDAMLLFQIHLLHRSRKP